MATVTKNILPVRDYQVWTTVAGEVNCVAGEVLGVYESLGGRVADTVTIETTTGDSRVRFNVVTQVYREHQSTHSGYMDSAGRTYAGGTIHNQFALTTRGSPDLVTEIQDTGKADVVIQNGTSQTWNITELGVKDIRLVHASGIRITVT